MVEAIHLQYYPTPCGTLRLGSFNGQLCLCDWVNGWHGQATEHRLKRGLKADFIEAPSAVIDDAKEQLEAYFHQKCREFELPLLFVGTAFQKRVWDEMMHIPYGATLSYGEMARNLGMPKAVRAVANANGANPISIIAPCHRVIGSDGTLTGYGGGLQTKQYLLDLESHH